MRKFMWTVLATGVAASIALAGCSSTVTGSAAPQGATAPQQGAPQQQQPVKVSTVADLGAAVQHTASAHNSVHVRMAMAIPGAGSINSAGVLRFGSGGVAEQMSMTVPGAGAIEVILLDGSVYEKLPSAAASALGTDKPWLKVDLSGSPLAGPLGTASLSNQADPTQLLQQITKSGTITKVSHETLNGTATTHYAITVDVAKMVQTMTGNDQEKQALSELHVGNVPFDIWVDSNNLPVRITSKTAYANPLTDESLAVTMTLDYSGWGQPVTIQAPPADQVGTLGPH
jgi:hypothetical protein